MNIKTVLIGGALIGMTTGCVTQPGDDCSSNEARESLVKYLKEEGGVKKILKLGYMNETEARQMMERINYSFDTVGSTKKEDNNVLKCKGKFVVEPKPDLQAELAKVAEEQSIKGTMMKDYGFKGIAERSGYLPAGDNKATFMVDFEVTRNKAGKIVAEADWENTGYFADFMANIAESLTHARRED